MTKPWNLSGAWPGATVAILGNGPTMTAEVAESMRAHKTIVVHRAVRFAPWADLFLAIDPEHHAELEFDGVRVVGCECDADALYHPAPHERVTLAPGYSLEIRNNLLAAIRLAADLGAAKIILCGIDTAAYEQLHHFPGLTVGLGAVVHEMRARGIEVEGGEKSPLVYRAMPGLGDSVHARAVLRELAKSNEVWFDTRWPEVVADLPVHVALDAPAGAREVACGYYHASVFAQSSVLAAMSKEAGVPVGDFRLPIPDAWKAKAAALLKKWKPKKPLMVLRPLIETAAGMSAARNPDPVAYRALYESIRAEYFVVSVANCRAGQEWLVDELEADVKCNAGELDLETLCALFAAAQVVFCHPGFAAVLAQAASTPSICVFGGYEDARSFAAGVAYAPWLGIEPITPCPCWSLDCKGDKTIDLPAATSRIQAFLAALE